MMSWSWPWHLHLSRAALGAVALLAACDADDMRGTTGAAAPLNVPSSPPRVPGSALIPGDSAPAVTVANPYWRSPDALRDGQRLYDWYNCSGCHAGGGGGMGPPLMDARWIYGSRPANLFDVIVEGRPGGMPAFGGMIPEDEIWKIVAYVTSMGGVPQQSATADQGGASQQQNQSQPQK